MLGALVVRLEPSRLTCFSQNQAQILPTVGNARAIHGSLPHRAAAPPSFMARAHACVFTVLTAPHPPSPTPCLAHTSTFGVVAVCGECWGRDTAQR
jgi:hypothetical protein